MPFVAEKLDVPSRDRETLEGWLRAPSIPQALALRARIIPGLGEGQGVRAMARRLGTTVPTGLLVEEAIWGPRAWPDSSRGR